MYMLFLGPQKKGWLVCRDPERDGASVTQMYKPFLVLHKSMVPVVTQMYNYKTFLVPQKGVVPMVIQMYKPFSVLQKGIGPMVTDV